MKQVRIYTDGACSKNPGPGGWGCVLLYHDLKKEISGFEVSTTNQQMELTAVIKGLQELKEPCEVEIYSDSAYVVDNAQPSVGRVYNWRSNGWTLQSGAPPKNVELWKEFLDAVKPHRYSFVKVVAHSGDVNNDKCDELAKKGYIEYTLKKKQESLKRAESRARKVGVNADKETK
ncbi:ribonuclease H [Clostridia bacterium]|nr:ribonuclease H [Clostridia bacterium]